MKLAFIDYACIIGYMSFIIIFGSHFARQQTSTKNYFLAGKSMGWLPLAISMYATLFSSISYVMAPAEAFRHDLQYLICMAMFPIASILAVVFFIDFYLRLKITTIYEYIEARFNKCISWIILVTYIIFRAIYAGIVVFALSLVLHVTMGLNMKLMIVCVGIGAIIYTTLGGLKAVIWCDVAQFIVLFGGLILALFYAVSKVDGGFVEIWRVAGEAGKLRVINTDFDLTERYVLWTLIVYGIFGFLGQKTVDQMTVQRFLSAKSPRSAKLSILVNSCFTLPVWALLFSVGMCLFAYYKVNPSPVVSQFIAEGKFDRIFPHYIFSVMPAGIRGIMIAALVAAAMSTMDSVLNVLSTVSIVSIYKKIINPDATDYQCLVRAKIMTIVWGLIVMALAFSMINIESILKTVNSIIGITAGPILGIFILAMFVRRANSPGAFIGVVLSFALVLYFNIFLPQITFTIYVVVGMVAALIFGYLASLFFPSPDAEKIGPLLWKWHGFKEMFFGGQRDTIEIN